MNKISMEVIDQLVSKYGSNLYHKGFRFVAAHSYFDKHDEFSYMKIRLKHQNGDKWIRPFHYIKEMNVWELGEPDFPDGKPLYKLPDILNNCKDKVWFSEGESCVDEIGKLGLLATTSGSATSAESADFLPLANREVIIWPDNNDAGWEFTEKVASKLLGLGASVWVVDISGLNLPEGGDVVDWVRQTEGLGLHGSELRDAMLELPLIKMKLKKANEAYIKGVDENSRHLSYVLASNVQIKQYDWIWEKFIARGKVVIIAGDPGVAKSQLCASIANIVTRGSAWPDKTESVCGNAVFLNAEDAADDTIVPRLMAAGADLQRVAICEAIVDKSDGEEIIQHFSIADDLEQLEKVVNDVKDVAVIFIDPITAYLGKTDDHKNAAIRSVMALLSDFAARHNVAIIGISHNSKGKQQNALMKVIGSIGFVAAARAAFAVVKDPDDNNKRLFLPLKNNIGPDNAGFSFFVEQCDLAGGIQTSRIVWTDEVVTRSADEIMSSGFDADARPALEDAKDFLSDILCDGRQLSEDVFSIAEKEGISDKTLRRAKKVLKIKSQREGFGKGGKVYWVLPENDS